jgi:hypothetical protein
MKIAHSLALVCLFAFAGAASAQQPAAPAAAPAAPAAKPAAPAAPAAKPRSAKSLECSKQADTQSLHGKARKGFMSKCKKS